MDSRRCSPAGRRALAVSGERPHACASGVHREDPRGPCAQSRGPRVQDEGGGQAGHVERSPAEFDGVIVRARRRRRQGTGGRDRSLLDHGAAHPFMSPGGLFVSTPPPPAVPTRTQAAARLVAGAAARVVGFVTNRLSLVYHVGVVIVSAAIAATLPFTFAFLAQRLLVSWSAIEDEKFFLVSTEIAVALVLVFVLSHARTNWRNRRLAKIARPAGMVHLSAGNGALARRAARRLKERHAFMRDIMIIGSTGFRTLVDPKGDLRAVIENCRNAKVMPLDPESRGAIERVRTIGEREVSRDSLRAQVEQTIAFLRALPAAHQRIRLKLYPEPPLWKIAILGDQAWVRHYHPAVDVRVLPEYVFVHRQDPGGLFVAFYQYFVARWDDPAIPEYDLLTGDLVYRDGARPEVVGAVPIPVRHAR